MAHKTEESDPESGGDDDDGYEDPYADIDIKAFVKELEEQQDKNIVPKPPPTDATMRPCSWLVCSPLKKHQKRSRLSWRHVLILIFLWAIIFRLFGGSLRSPELV